MSSGYLGLLSTLANYADQFHLYDYCLLLSTSGFHHHLDCGIVMGVLT